MPTAPLLARADGSAWNKDAWKYPIKDAVIAAELPAAATAYALRHSTITDLIALHRLDTLTVAQLSGASLLMIEKHYGHLLREHAAKALAVDARLRSVVQQVHADDTQTSLEEDVPDRRSHTTEITQPAPAAKATTSSGDQRA